MFPFPLCLLFGVWRTTHFLPCAAQVTASPNTGGFQPPATLGGGSPTWLQGAWDAHAQSLAFSPPSMQYMLPTDMSPVQLHMRNGTMHSPMHSPAGSPMRNPVQSLFRNFSPSFAPNAVPTNSHAPATRAAAPSPCPPPSMFLYNQMLGRMPWGPMQSMPPMQPMQPMETDSEAGLDFTDSFVQSPVKLLPMEVEQPPPSPTQLPTPMLPAPPPLPQQVAGAQQILGMSLQQVEGTQHLSLQQVAGAQQFGAALPHLASARRPTVLDMPLPRTLLPPPPALLSPTRLAAAPHTAHSCAPHVAQLIAPTVGAGMENNPGPARVPSAPITLSSWLASDCGMLVLAQANLAASRTAPVSPHAHGALFAAQPASNALAATACCPTHSATQMQSPLPLNSLGPAPALHTTWPQALPTPLSRPSLPSQPPFQLPQLQPQLSNCPPTAPTPTHSLPSEARPPSASALPPPASTQLPPASSLAPPASTQLPSASSLAPPASTRLPSASTHLPQRSHSLELSQKGAEDASSLAPLKSMHTRHPLVSGQAEGVSILPPLQGMHVRLPHASGGAEGPSAERNDPRGVKLRFTGEVCSLLSVPATAPAPATHFSQNSITMAAWIKLGCAGGSGPPQASPPATAPTGFAGKHRAGGEALRAQAFAPNTAPHSAPVPAPALAPAPTPIMQPTVSASAFMPATEGGQANSIRVQTASATHGKDWGGGGGQAPVPRGEGAGAEQQGVWSELLKSGEGALMGWGGAGQMGTRGWGVGIKASEGQQHPSTDGSSSPPLTAKEATPASFVEGGLLIGALAQSLQVCCSVAVFMQCVSVD